MKHHTMHLILFLAAWQVCAVTSAEWKEVLSSETLSVLLNGNVAGQMITSTDLRNDTVIVSSSLETSLGSGTATPIVASISENHRYRLDGSLISAFQEMKSPSGKNYWSLENVKGQWVLKVTAGGVENSRIVENVKDNLINSYCISSGMKAKKIKVSQQWADTALELTSGENVYIRTICAETPSVSNSNTWRFTERNSINNRDELWVLDSSGKTVFKEEFPFVMKKASMTKKDSSTVNIFEAFMIPSERAAAEDEKILLIGDSSFAPDKSVMGFYSMVKNGFELKKIGSPCSKTTEIKIPDSLKQYLQATPTMQTDHPEIKALAGKFSKYNDLCVKINAMCMYVYKNLRKQYTATFSSALETSRAGFGDCGEHTVLLAAMLRAQGIPARVVFGVVYLNAKGYFYHAWVMVYDGNKWIFADPALGVFPADRDRIPLVIDDSGEKMVALARVIGRLKVQYVK